MKYKKLSCSWILFRELVYATNIISLLTKQRNLCKNWVNDEKKYCKREKTKVGWYRNFDLLKGIWLHCQKSLICFTLHVRNKKHSYHLIKVLWREEIVYYVFFTVYMYIVLYCIDCIAAGRRRRKCVLSLSPQFSVEPDGGISALSSVITRIFTLQLVDFLAFVLCVVSFFLLVIKVILAVKKLIDAPPMIKG